MVLRLFHDGETYLALPLNTRRGLPPSHACRYRVRLTIIHSFPLKKSVDRPRLTIVYGLFCIHYESITRAYILNSTIGGVVNIFIPGPLQRFHSPGVGEGVRIAKRYGPFDQGRIKLFEFFPRFLCVDVFESRLCMRR